MKLYYWLLSTANVQNIRNSLKSHLHDVPLRGRNVESHDLLDEAAGVLGVEVEGGLVVGGVALGDLRLGGESGEWEEREEQ